MKQRAERRRHRRNGYWAESGFAQVTALEAVGMLSLAAMGLFILIKKPKPATAGLGLAYNRVRFR